MAYFVFMIDLKDSRKMGEAARRESQARLKETRDALNGFLAGAARVEFSSGDSLQGYTKDAALALRICLLAVYLMHPRALHCGIGAGEIYVLSEDTNASDGPAYHDALQSLEEAKKEEREIVSHFGTTADELIGHLLLSIELLRKRNTEKQNLYVSVMCLIILADYRTDILNEVSYFTEKRNDISSINTTVRYGDLPIEYIMKFFGTTAQNNYDMMRKANTMAIVSCYESCLKYLSSSQEVN